MGDSGLDLSSFFSPYTTGTSLLTPAARCSVAGSDLGTIDLLLDFVFHWTLVGKGPESKSVNVRLKGVDGI